MGKTERISSHCACRAPSDFGGAPKFGVVIVLFTGASSIRRGHPEIEPLPLCVLRDIAVRSPLPLPDVLLHLERVEHDRQTPMPASKGRWRIPLFRIPPPSLPEPSPARACAASLAPEYEPPEGMEKIAPIVPCIRALPP